MKDDKLIVDMNLGVFPKKISFRHKKDKNREWYEFNRGSIAIVIQRLAPEPFFVFFINKKEIRTLNVLRDGREYVFAAKSFREAVKALEQLGFSVKAMP